MKTRMAPPRATAVSSMVIAAVLTLTQLLLSGSARAATFAEAADSTGITWTQSGSGRSWQALTSASASHDGVDVLESAPAPGQANWSNYLEATLTGPGVFSYWLYTGQPSTGNVIFDLVSGGQTVYHENISNRSYWQPVTVYLPRAASYTIKWASLFPDTAAPGIRIDQCSFIPSVTTIADALDAPGITWSSTGPEPWLTVTGAEAADGTDFLAASLLSNSPPVEISATINGPAWIEFKWKDNSNGKKAFLLNGSILVENNTGPWSWIRERHPLPPGPNVVTWRATPGQSAFVGTIVMLDKVAVQPVTDGVSLADALDSGGSWSLANSYPHFHGRSAPGLGRNDNDAAVTELGVRTLAITVPGPGTLSGWARLRKGSSGSPDILNAVSIPSIFLPYNYFVTVPDGGFGAWVPFNIAVGELDPSTVNLRLNYTGGFPINQPVIVPELHLDEVKFTPDIPAESVSLPNISISLSAPGTWKSSSFSGQTSFHRVRGAVGAMDFTVTGPGDFSCSAQTYSTYYPFFQSQSPALSVDGVPAGGVSGPTTIHVGPGVHRIGCLSGVVVNPAFTPGPGIGGALEIPDLTVVAGYGRWSLQSDASHNGPSSLRRTLNSDESSSYYNPVVVLPAPGRLSWWHFVPAGVWTKTEIISAGVVTLSPPFSSYVNASLWLDDVSFTPLTATLAQVKATSGVADILTSPDVALMPGGFGYSPVPGPTSALFDAAGQFITPAPWAEVRTPGPGRLSFRSRYLPLDHLVIDGHPVEVMAENPWDYRPVKIDLPGPGSHVVRFNLNTYGGQAFVDTLLFDPNVRDIGAAVGLGSVPWLTAGLADAKAVSDPSASGGSYAVLQIVGDEEQPGATFSAPGAMPANAFASARLRYRYPGVPYTSLKLSERTLPYGASGQWLTETVTFLGAAYNEFTGFTGRSTTIPSLPVEVHVDDIAYSTHSYRTLAEALDCPAVTWETNITLTDPFGGEVYPPTGVWYGTANSQLFTDGDGAYLANVQTQDFLGGRNAFLKGTVGTPGTLTWWWRLDPRASDTFWPSGPSGGPPRSQTFVRSSAHVGPTAFHFNATQRGISTPYDVVFLDRVSFVPDSVQTSFTAWSTALLPGTPDPNRDYDGDGVSDVFEYAFNGIPTDPLDPGTLPAITLINPNAAATQLRLTWPQRKGTALTYSPEFTSSLETPSWQPPATPPVITSYDSTWDQAIVTVSPAPGHARVFGRVRITTAP